MSKDFSATGLKTNRVRYPVDVAVSFLIWVGTICTLISGVLFLIPQLTGGAALGAFSGLTAFADAILWALMISTLVQVASVLLGLLRVYAGTSSTSIRAGIWLAPLLSTALMVGASGVFIFLMTGGLKIGGIS